MSLRTSNVRVLISSFLVLFIASSAGAEVRYAALELPSAIDTDDSFAYSPSLTCRAVNSNGVVVGEVSGWIERWNETAQVTEQIEVDRVFYWQPGMPALKMVDPTGHPELPSSISSINDNGIALGLRSYGTGYLDKEVFLLDTATEQVTDLPRPNTQSSYAFDRAINELGEVVATGSLEVIYWDDEGQGQTLLTRDDPGPYNGGDPRDINNPGVIVGKMYLDGDETYQDRPFKHILANGNTYELPILADGDGGAVRCINDAGRMGGMTNVSRPQYPSGELRDVPCYWDSSGTVYDLRPLIPWWDSASSETACVSDVAEDGTLLIQGNSFTTNIDDFLYNPDTDSEATCLQELLKPGSPYESLAILDMAREGTLLGEAYVQQGGDYIVRSVVFDPYEVALTDMSVGQNQAVALNGGPGVAGGCEISFEEVISGGSLATHYGQGPAADFAVTFLPDPDDLDDVSDNLLPGDAQYWSIDLEGGEVSGTMELTFCYDPAMLPAGLEGEGLVVLHHTVDGWETLVPIDRADVAHTLTVQTDSLSPFLLAQIPEPGTLSLLAAGGLALIRRRR